MIEYTTEIMWGSRLTLRASGTTTAFKQLLPGPQGDRLFSLAGGLISGLTVSTFFAQDSRRIRAIRR